MDHPSSSPAAPAAWSPLGFGVAVAAAAFGGLMWFAIATVIGREFAIAAWGLGLLVGFATLHFGGRGKPVAVAAAALTLLSIFLGKVMADGVFVEQAIEHMTSTAAFEEAQRDAEGWSHVDPRDDDAVRDFMVAHGFAGSKADAKKGMIWFRRNVAPELERMSDEEPSYAQWQRATAAELHADIAAEGSAPTRVLAGMDLYDALFAFLAVATAFGMVASAPTPRPVPRALDGDQRDDYRRAA